MSPWTVDNRYFGAMVNRPLSTVNRFPPLPLGAASIINKRFILSPPARRAPAGAGAAVRSGALMEEENQAETPPAPQERMDQAPPGTGPNADGQSLLVNGVERPSEPPPESPGFFHPLLLVVLGFWALWIWTSSRQKRRRKQEEDRQKTLAKGDRVITIGRMHGVVVAFTDETVTLLTDAKNGAVMVFDRVAIYKILPRPGEEDEKKVNS